MIVRNTTKALLLKEIEKLRLENSLQKTSCEHPSAGYKFLNNQSQAKGLNFEAVCESVSSAMLIIDESTHVLWLNRAARNLCGCSELKTQHQRFGHVLNCANSQKSPGGCGCSVKCRNCELKNAIEDLIVRGGLVSGVEIELELMPNGIAQKHWMELGIQTISENDQKYWCIILNDCTGRKLTEESLRSSEERFHSIFNNLQDAYFQADLTGNFTLVSPSALSMFGYDSVDELIGRPASMLYAYKKDREFLLGELKAKGSLADFVCQGRRKDGSLFWVSMNSQFKFLKGKVVGTVGIVRDITERKLAQEKVKESEEKLQNIFDNLQDGYFEVDLNGQFTSLSPSAIRMYDINAKDSLPGLSTSEIYSDPQDREEILTLLAAKKRVLDYVCRGKRKDKSTFWVSISVQYKYNAQGEPVGIIGVVRDITERKQAEDLLRESETRFREVLENSTDASYKRNLKTNVYDYLSPVFEHLSGFTSEEINALPMEALLEMVHPDDVQQISRSIAHALSAPAGLAFQVEYRFKHKTDGQYRSLNDKFTVMRDALGQPLALIGSVSDISERKLAEEELIAAKEKSEQSEYRLKLATASGRLGIWDWNVQTNEQTWNERMLEFYGIDQDTFSQIIDPWANGMHPEDRERAIEECNAALRGDKDYNTTFRVLQPGGKMLYLKADGLVIRDAHGKPMRMIGINRDITEARLAREQLIQAKERAEESDRLKSAFLANMSHEIRTPINSIIGFSELLDDPDFDQQQKQDFTRTIVENGNNLLVIISDILDLSMLESGQMTIRKQPLSVNQLLADLEDEFKIKALHKGIAFRVLIPDGFENTILDSDFYRVRQVFANLISNSLKFTPQGSIEIGFFPIDRGIEFYVQDTGIGIASKFHEDVFTRFRQVDETRTRKYGGNGLGLAISKNIVEILGGKIRVESEPGKGCRFMFILPGN